MDMICTGGPYGDQCSNYTVTGPNTVQELLDKVLTEKPKEWGFISLDTWVSEKFIEYRYGKILYNGLEPNDMYRTIEQITAHGGWSRMDYCVKLL